MWQHFLLSKITFYSNLYRNLFKTLSQKEKVNQESLGYKKNLLAVNKKYRSTCKSKHKKHFQQHTVRDITFKKTNFQHRGKDQSPFSRFPPWDDETKHWIEYRDACVLFPREIQKPMFCHCRRPIDHNIHASPATNQNRWNDKDADTWLS